MAAIDIGSHKMIAALATVNDEGVDIHYHCEIPSKGVIKGSITNISLVRQAIDNMIDVLQQQSGLLIHSVILSAGGVGLVGFNAEGSVKVTGTTISDDDILAVLRQAKSSTQSDNRRLIHLLSQEFIVDYQTGIDDPAGLVGNQLTARVHAVTIPETTFLNAQHALDHMAVEAEDVTASCLASGYAVTTNDERKLGVCVLDIGSSVTDMSVFINGKVQHTEVIPIGGESITSDIAFYLRTTSENAEKIKYQIDLTKHYPLSDTISVSVIAGAEPRLFQKSEISNVMTLRCEQLAEMVMRSLRRSGFEDAFPVGFVLCGGASEQIGLSRVFERATKHTVRVATTHSEQVMFQPPAYATLAGLFMTQHYSRQFHTVTRPEKEGIMTRFSKSLSSIKNKLITKF